MAGTNKATAFGLTGLGVLLVWSGIRGASITGSFRDLLSGKQPTAGTNPITGASATGEESTGGSFATGSVIANTALQYRGVAPYKWGGSSPSGWDCSGMVNYVLGKALGMAIPGYPTGNYSGHGPVTGQYYVWSGAKTIPVSQAQAGDLVCWLSHMGIAVSNSQVISALDTQMGTAVTTFAQATPFGEPMRIRRLVA